MYEAIVPGFKGSDDKDALSRIGTGAGYWFEPVYVWGEPLSGFKTIIGPV